MHPIDAPGYSEKFLFPTRLDGFPSWVNTQLQFLSVDATRPHTAADFNHPTLSQVFPGNPPSCCTFQYPVRHYWAQLRDGSIAHMLLSSTGRPFGGGLCCNALEATTWGDYAPMFIYCSDHPRFTLGDFTVSISQRHQLWRAEITSSR